MYKVDEKVIVNLSGETATVKTVDERYHQVEVQYEDGSYEVLGWHKVRRKVDEC
ncbi:hypothetical protein SFC27_10510 [Bacillus licheniformis]|uniref:DUF2187 domain-containing protein n=1 Tax=Bacillus licheniformis TaxID=1402 RepID=A0A8B5YAE7_BACLI|nr:MULTISPECIES: hypothetical protein [Bacillus]AVI45435.1 SPBc2 prophage-derived uncharacterized protein YorQ [Bacillus licheniformis]AYC54065.1 hypothetical protein C7M53_0110 [Bacillus licheniformis]EQM25390.1 hypothetical protein N399_24380 [Bacillus licheniformis CG-B52]MBU8781576.1 hypothetical protein [Bacillus licheniformis]MBU8799479.1 hypothetical protein [Bacillus licheniformis]